MEERVLGLAENFPALLQLHGHLFLQLAHLLQVALVHALPQLQRRHLALGVSLGPQPLLLQVDCLGQLGLFLLELGLQRLLPLLMEGSLEVLRDAHLVVALAVLGPSVLLLLLLQDQVANEGDVFPAVLPLLPFPGDFSILIFLFPGEQLRDLLSLMPTCCFSWW